MPTNSERHGGKSAEVEERRGRGRVIRSGNGGGDGCKVGIEEGGMEAGKATSISTRRYGGTEVAGAGMEAGPKNSGTLIGGEDAKRIRRMGGGVKEELIEGRDGAEGRLSSISYKGGDEIGLADGGTKDTVTGKGGAAKATEHTGSTLLRRTRRVTERISDVTEMEEERRAEEGVSK